MLNNDVTWPPTESNIDGIYEADYSYYYDDANEVGEYDWRPYDPTENEVNVTSYDELTAPSPDSLLVNETIEKSDPEALPFLQNYYNEYSDYRDDVDNATTTEIRKADKHENVVIDSCPSSRCRCVCDADD